MSLIFSCFFTVANKAFGKDTWVNDKRHTWSQWRYGHSTLAVDGKLDTNLPNCAIMDNYYVDKPLWRVDLGSKVTVNGAVILTWQGAGQGMLCCYINNSVCGFGFISFQIGFALSNRLNMKCS